MGWFGGFFGGGGGSAPGGPGGGPAQDRDSVEGLSGLTGYSYDAGEIGGTDKASYGGGSTTSVARGAPTRSQRPQMRPDNLRTDTAQSRIGGVNTAPASTPAQKNTFKQNLNNLVTPFDNVKYEKGVNVFGALPDDIRATPRSFTNEELANFTTKNTAKENFANFLTPFDGARYTAGNLIEEATGRSLTGGGTIANKGGKQDYIYGVADDFSNNATLARGNMSQQDYNQALGGFNARQSQLEQNITPFGSYLASFLPYAIPTVGTLVGGKIGENMLSSGIESRRDMMDRHQAALDRGAIPSMVSGNYTGYTDTDGSFVSYDDTSSRDTTDSRGVDPVVGGEYGALGVGMDGEPPAPDVSDPVVVIDTDQDSDDPDEIIYASPMYEEFQFSVLPGLLTQTPDMTQEDIDAAFRIYRDAENAL